MPHRDDDARDEQVRRLLADARHTDPMPADVVARLDGVLADLAAEPSRERPVTDLATRRRRVSQLLVAAAAVVAVGVGLQQVVLDPGGGDASESSAADAAADGADAEAFGAEEGGAAGSTESAPEALLAPDTDGLFRLRARNFAADVQTVAQAAEQRAGVADEGVAEGGPADAVLTACAAQEWGEGTFVAVRYGNSPAVLVLRRVLGDTRVADLYLCGSDEPVRSVTLPAP